MREARPTVYVIAGPNGAGKTTFARDFLPDFVRCREFLNADLIAAGLSPFAPDSQNLRAGRLLLERIGELTKEKVDFGFETTLSGKVYAERLGAMKKVGYRVVLFFLWLPSAGLAVDRVSQRVKKGGHHVPDADIRRRYSLGLKNFFRLYLPILDSWVLYDSSRLPPAVIASTTNSRVKIVNDRLYHELITEYGGTTRG